MDAREQVIQTIAANKDQIEEQMHSFWRRFAEDMIKGGIPAEEVVSSMVAVAGTQAMKVHGATYMAHSFRKMADAFQFAADHGCEYPAAEH